MFDMKALDLTLNHPSSSRRPPVRVETDGPWCVSVAETPHDARSYSLYIKTPTHNLTLTRTASELIELDRKLRDLHPQVKVPDLPQMNSTPPPKRKSTFLNTLSRLASPNSSKIARPVSTAGRRNNVQASPSPLPTPQRSPTSDIADPFSSFSETSPTQTSPSATSTSIAAYLTAVANQPSLRQERVWKRFVRVRTDDLESVRVERAIKRVRSDLAAHMGTSKEAHSPSAVQSENVNGHGGQEEQKPENGELQTDPIDAGNALAETPVNELDGHVNGADSTVDSSDNVGEANVSDGTPSKHEDGGPVMTDAAVPNGSVGDLVAPSTPDTPLSRIHRSQSADPDKSSRMPRVYASSPTTPSSQTEDESSVSTVEKNRAKKKRSLSTAPKEPKKSQRKVIIDDFEMMRVLGKGCAGKVLLVRHKSTTELYALKAITKRHVLAHQELQHTLTEQAVLKRMAAEGKDPFVVKLWWSFHDKENLFLVMDFHPGGDLATQLARWGRLGRDRARFYAAEIVEGVEGLHNAGVIYRDLKPENILIGADGHIVLTDFGLSKEFSRRQTGGAPSTPASLSGDFGPVGPPWVQAEKNTDLATPWHPQANATTTFCGTAEYLAPEVIQGLPYSYEVDWWSFGTMLYEMLTGITPFWANNHPDMYVRVLQDELQFPDDRTMDQDTKSLIRGLLQRNPALRMCEPRIKKHPYFSMIDWSHVYYKRYIPPYIPPIDPSNASDTQNFDDTFLDMEPVLDEYVEEGETDQEPASTDTDRTDGEDSGAATPLQSRSPSRQNVEEDTVDVFDGYSFKGRYSLLIDDEVEEEGEEEQEEKQEDLDMNAVLESHEAVTVQVQQREKESEKGPEEGPEEEPVEPKTPEARAAEVEPISEEVPPLPLKEPAQVTDAITSSEILDALPSTPPPELPVKDPKLSVTHQQAPVPRQTNNRTQRVRREKSGIPALDRYLSDGDDNQEAERDEDSDDDWDLIDAVDGEDRNGAKGTSLFARGVVDRYRLAVFRSRTTPQRNANRSASGMSKNSEVAVSNVPESPSSDQRRGRSSGLPFKKRPRQFLRAKSPSTKSSKTKPRNHSNTNTLSTTSTFATGMFNSSPSLSSTVPTTPTLRSKESATSVGARSQSSGQSGNGDAGVAPDASEATKSNGTIDVPEKNKTKKLRKYKENAERVFFLFSSQRQAS